MRRTQGTFNIMSRCSMHNAAVQSVGDTGGTAVKTVSHPHTATPITASVSPAARAWTSERQRHEEQCA